LLESDGWSFSRHGNNHDIYRKGDKQEAVPRHKEINEILARAILSRNNIQKKEKMRIKELK
jgi:mRNA interferase HicA